MKSEETYLVSIIVAAYNVEDYIDDCLDSIADQTYDNIEVLMVVREGGDNTYNKCEKRPIQDARFRLVSQKSKGLGPARNEGVDEANGDYICFVDGDDWLEKDYVEVMLNEIEKENVDFVECNFWISNEDGSSLYRGNYDLRYVLGEEIGALYSYPAAWKYLCKRSIWVEQEIMFPNTAGEDFAIYLLLVLCVYIRKSYVKNALYHYRVRQDSLTYTWLGSVDNVTRITEAYDYLIEGFKKTGLFEKYKRSIELCIGYSMWSEIQTASNVLELNDLDILVNRMHDFLHSRFGKSVFDNRIKVFGSYSLGRISNALNLDDYKRVKYGFSSIISVMSPPENNCVISNKNAFRDDALKKEVKRSFLTEEVLTDTDVILIDLLDERYDICRVGDSYYTKSEAFVEAETNIRVDETIDRRTERCTNLFETSFDMFIKKTSMYKDIKVIVVENYLCERKGRYMDSSFFDNLEEIKRMNEILKGYYKYIEDHYPKVLIVRLDNNDLNYTEVDFEYGCYPWHMNRAFYFHMGYRVQECL